MSAPGGSPVPFPNPSPRTPSQRPQQTPSTETSSPIPSPRQSLPPHARRPEVLVAEAARLIADAMLEPRRQPLPSVRTYTRDCPEWADSTTNS